jgi:putative hydrolase of the HAD superfamily
MSALSSTSITPSWPGSSPADVALVGNRAEEVDQSLPRALLFELDNVLHDATHWQRWLWQLLTRMGLQRDFHGFCAIWQRGYMHEVYRGGREFASALRAFLVDSGMSAGQIDEVEAASAARRRELSESVRPLPGVVKTLSHLAGAGVILGVLANSEWSGNELRERIDRLGLKGRFQFVFSSRDLGHAKPEPSCYQAALDTLRMPSHAVAFVSCETDDLAGAAAVGLRTVAVNVDTEAHADFSLRRFDELLTVCVMRAANSAQS